MRTTRVQPNACGGEVALNHIDAAMDWQIVKQCDLVNLFWMIPDRFDRETMLRNYLHYEDGTIHMSSLSPNTSSLVAARLGLDDTGAYRNLFASASVDLEDYQFNAEWGRHMAAIGGAWLALIFGFGGLCLDSRMDLDLRPRLHPGWTRLRYRFHWQGRRIEVTVERDALSLRLLEGQPVELRAWGRPVALTDELAVGSPME
jgi:trehalose/maltose hydrolase-like predicted phosphorylase